MLVGESEGHSTIPSVERIRTKLVLPPRIIDLPDHPVRQANIEEFRRELCIDEESRGLVEKICENIRYVGERDFRKGIDNINQEMTHFIDKQPFYVVIDQPGRSGEYVYKMLHFQGRSPEGVIMLHNSNSYPSKIRNEAKVVLLDDAAYSGARIFNMFDYFRSMSKQARSITLDDMIVCLVGTTDTALSHIVKNTGIENIVATYRIPVLSQIFSAAEQKDLAKMFPDFWFAFNLQVLTFLYYRVPDNFPPSFKKSQSHRVGDRKIFLVDDTPTGVYPPYWDF